MDCCYSCCFRDYCISCLSENKCFKPEDDIKQEELFCVIPNIWTLFRPCLTEEECLDCYAFTAYKCSICTVIKGFEFTVEQLLCPLGCVGVPCYECGNSCSNTCCSKDSCCYNI